MSRERPRAFNIKDTHKSSDRKGPRNRYLERPSHTVPFAFLTGWKSQSDSRQHPSMRKRQRQDATKTVGHATWLIVQDRMDELIGHVELAPFTDHEEILSATIEELQRRGWMIEAAPRLSSVGFFCHREGERWFVHIVHYNPTRSCPYERPRARQLQ
jgi:hypothetical protein